ncbi:unnamed protein product [Diamesa hyperborea]
MLRAVVSFRNKEICLIRKITGTQTNLCKTKQPKEDPEQKCYIIKTRSENHNKKEILYESDLIKAAKKKECLQNAQEAKRKECPNALEKLMQKVKEMMKFELLEQQFAEKYKILINKQIYVQQKIQNRLISLSLKQQLPTKKEMENKIFEMYHNQFLGVKTVAEQPKTLQELILRQKGLITKRYQDRVNELKTYYQQNIPEKATRNWEVVNTATKNKITEVTTNYLELIKTSLKKTPEMATRSWELIRKSYYFRYMKQVPFMIIENTKIAFIYADAYFQIFMQSQFKAEMVKIAILTFDTFKKTTIKLLILTREAITAYIVKNPPNNLLKKK